MTRALTYLERQAQRFQKQQPAPRAAKPTATELKLRAQLRDTQTALAEALKKAHTMKPKKAEPMSTNEMIERGEILAKLPHKLREAVAKQDIATLRAVAAQFTTTSSGRLSPEHRAQMKEIAGTQNEDKKRVASIRRGSLQIFGVHVSESDLAAGSISRRGP